MDVYTFYKVSLQVRSSCVSLMLIDLKNSLVSLLLKCSLENHLDENLTASLDWICANNQDLLTRDHSK